MSMSSFTMNCPFCGRAMTAPEEMAGQTAQCPTCGEEVYLDPGDSARREEERRAQEIRTMRAAAVASQPATMPKVTWEWAFEFVLKVSIAAAVIDGIFFGLIWIALAIAAQSRHY